MTRRAGFVPVHLSRCNAQEIAKWIATFRLQEPTILGSVGIATNKLEANARRDLQLLSDLAGSLCDAPTGRPRQSVSKYDLPVAALRIIDNGWAAIQMPRKLRPKIRRMLRAIYRRRGPKLSRITREKNLRNGYYTPETVRKYRRLLAKPDILRPAPKLEMKDQAIHLAILPQFRKSL